MIFCIFVVLVLTVYLKSIFLVLTAIKFHLKTVFAGAHSFWYVVFLLSLSQDSISLWLFGIYLISLYLWMFQFSSYYWFFLNLLSLLCSPTYDLSWNIFHMHLLEKNVYCGAVGWTVLHVCWIHLAYGVIQIYCLLIFCLSYLSIDESGALKSLLLLYFCIYLTAVLLIFVLIISGPTMLRCIYIFNCDICLMNWPWNYYFCLLCIFITCLNIQENYTVSLVNV